MYDWESGRGSDNDFLSNRGFATALRDTLRLRRGGLLFAGLPCGSWLGWYFIIYIYDVYIYIYLEITQLWIQNNLFASLAE